MAGSLAYPRPMSLKLTCIDYVSQFLFNKLTQFLSKKMFFYQNSSGQWTCDRNVSWNLLVSRIPDRAGQLLWCLSKWVTFRVQPSKGWSLKLLKRREYIQEHIFEHVFSLITVNQPIQITKATSIRKRSLRRWQNGKSGFVFWIRIKIVGRFLCETFHRRL